MYKLNEVMSPPSPIQSKVYDFIISHYHHHQTLPNKSEIRYGLEFNNYNSVVVALDGLLKKGWLEPSYTSVGYLVTALKKQHESNIFAPTARRARPTS